MTEPFDISTFAKSNGWIGAEVSKPEISEDTKSKFHKWLKNYGGHRMSYLERRKIERLSPKDYFPQIQSILVFADYYHGGWAKGPIKISNYAFGRDYHIVLKEKLENTMLKLQQQLGPFQYRIAVDTAPLLEKSIAAESGIGWQGKNTLILNPQFGSQFFLAEALTDIPLSKFQAKLAMTDHCGTCTRCIDACPTQALEPYVLKVDQCIAYWTLEHRGDFNDETPEYSEWIAGCDICQEVCPWNQRLIPLDVDNRGLDNLAVADIQDSSWTSRIAESALSYVPIQNWPRNLTHIAKVPGTPGT